MQWMMIHFLLVALLLLLQAIAKPSIPVWGTYRPGTYFGSRQRAHSSLVTGFSWFGLQDYNAYTDPRHLCNTDKTKFGFNTHSGRHFAHQTITDADLNLSFNTTWINMDDRAWIMRVHGSSLDSSLPASVALLYYTGFDGLPTNSELHVHSDIPPGSNHLIPFVTGVSDSLGKFSIFVRIDHNSNPTPRIVPLDLGQSTSDTTWLAISHFTDKVSQYAHTLISEFQAKYQDEMRVSDILKPIDIFTLPESSGHSSSNSAISQINIILGEGTQGQEFTLDYIFVSHKDFPDQDPIDVAKSFKITDMVDQHESKFQAQMQTVFNTNDKLSTYAVSNLLGGIGYFSGHQLENMSDLNEQDVFEWAYFADSDDESLQDVYEQWRIHYNSKTLQSTKLTQLLTATPSRSFFPRGFLWDEGFHLLVIMRFDLLLGCEILQAWLDVQDQDSGWIPREQILGNEARSRVPEKFRVQSPQIANPPTIMLAVEYLISKLKGSTSGMFKDPGQHQHVVEHDAHTEEQETIKHLLRKIEPKLMKLWTWFQNTQRGDIDLIDNLAKIPVNNYYYQWRGRTMNHNLASGLDDYPRSDPPTVGDLHLDLTSWMAWYANVMQQMYTSLSQPIPDSISEPVNVCANNILSAFWSTKLGFGDLAYKLEDDDEPWHLFVRIGYVSIIPYVLGLVDPVLNKPQFVWSLKTLTELSVNGHGVQSLHPTDPGIGKVDNYWRGNVWINFQYLILARLHKHAQFNTDAMQLYTKIRKDVIHVVESAFMQNGYLYEHYNGFNGNPGGSHPFTGWTSLIVLIRAELYH